MSKKTVGIIAVIVDIKANETAYMIPLEADASQGIKFDSEEYLEKKKVATKRIQIVKRWNQTGRMPNSGQWIPSVRVITVDRSPVTRQWQPGKQSVNALWLESMDSIGFSTGFSVTAFVEEDDTSKFLYMYKAESLNQVLDTEVRARIQSIAAEVGASYKMDKLREMKNELIDKIRLDVVPFFKKKGITISTIGQFGGFEYENPKIQDAIDNTFVAQQEKVNNAARLEAQKDANSRIEMEALAMAEAARTKAKGEADGKLSVAQAEAQGLDAINKAITAANQNPALIQIKQLEVFKALAEKWNGTVPAWIMSSGAGTNPANFLFNVTQPQAR